MKRLITAVISLLLFSQIPAWALNETEIELTKSSHSIIGLAEAHSLGFTGKGQTIVVLDTGVQIDHPYLKDALVSGYCSSRAVCGSNYDTPSIAAGASIKIEGLNIPIDSHGSMASGIAIGRAIGNIPGGVAPGANLISINNTDGQGEGIVRALDWVLSVKDKFNIVAVSASIGAPNQGSRNKPGNCLGEKEIGDRIRKLAEAGIAFVSASGNDGFTNNMTFPACLPEAISVGAIDYKGDITNYSNIAQSLNVLAPADVLGANASSGYWIGGGTSSATPVVAGAIAILKEVKPSATLSEIKQALATTTKFQADSMWKNIPVLNLPAAIKALQTGQFSKTNISTTVEVADTTKLDLASALAREKTLNDEIARLTVKVKDLETSNLKSETSLSEAKATVLALQNEAKASLDLITDLQNKMNLSNELIAKIEAANKATTTEMLTLQRDAKANSELITKLQGDLKLANELIAKLEAASKATTITCVKGKQSKKVTGIKPKCPTGYKKKV